MNKSSFGKVFGLSLSAAVSEVINQHVGEVPIDAIYEAVKDHPFVKLIDAEVLVEQAVRAAVDTEIGFRRKYVGIKTDCYSQVDAFLGDKWREHGMVFDGIYVANRHANREHNLRRLHNVRIHVERVVEAEKIEAVRHQMLEKAYSADKHILTNDDAIAWLHANEPSLIKDLDSLSHSDHAVP